MSSRNAMSPMSPPQPSPADTAPGALERVLFDLASRPELADPDTALRAIMEVAARALGAVAALWLLESSGEAVHLAVSYPAAASPAASPPASVAGLRQERLRIEPTETGGTALNAGVWRGGRLAGCVRFERGGPQPWTEAERCLAAAAADRAALALAEADRAHEEHELRERERKVAEVETLAGLGSWDWDIPADRITWSDQQFRLHGREPLPQVDYGWFFFHIHPDDRGWLGDWMDRSLATGEAFEFPYRIVRPDGRVRWLFARGKMIMSADGRPLRMIGTSRDITQQRLAEDALRASEARFREMFTQFPVSVQIFAPDGRTLQANAAYTRLWGVRIENLDGFNLLTDPQLEPIRDQLRRGFEGETVYLPPVLYDGRRVGSQAPIEVAWPRWIEAFMFPVRDVHGEVREVILVHQDVTEKKQAEEALRASEESYRTIFDLAGAAIWVHDLETGAFLDVNRMACEMYGYTVEESKALGVEGLSWGEPPYTAEQASEYIRRAVAGEPQRFEWLGRHKDGSKVWAEVTLRRVTILREDRLLATGRDITEFKAAETALRQSEESYRAIFHNSSDVIWVRDIETGALLDINQRACELYGYPVEEMMPLGLGDMSQLSPSYTLEQARENVARAVAGEPQRFEWPGRHKDGSTIWMEMMLRRVTILGEDRLLATGRDITDRKRAEEGLRLAERHAQAMADRMRAVAGAAAGVIGAESVDALLPVLRDACREVIPFDAFAFALFNETQHTLSFAEGYDADMLMPAKTISAAGTPGERVIRTRRSLVTRRADDPAAVGALPMGTGRRSESIIHTPILSGNRVLGILAVQSYTPDLYTEQDVEVLEAVASLASTALRNIELLAERRAAEQALRRANEELEIRVAERTADLAATNEALEEEIAEHEAIKEKLLERTREMEGIFQVLPDLYFRLGREGTILDHRAGNTESLYLPPDQFIGHRMQNVLPAELGFLLDEALDEIARTGELVCIEYSLSLPDGAHDFEARLIPLGGEQTIMVVRDITDRKQSEQALREREEHFRRLIENAYDLVQILDAQGRITYSGPSVQRLLGYKPEEIADVLSTEFMHPDDIKRVQARLGTLLAHPGHMVSAEYRVRHKDGSWRVFEGFGRTISDTSADDGVVINARDVTDRSLAEDALRQSEERFRALIENAHDITCILDTQGVMLYQSPSLQRVLGYAPEELVGRSSFEFMHPDDIPGVLAALDGIVRTPGSINRAEYRFRHKNGTWRHLEAFGRTLSPESVDDGVVANIRDVTGRKRAEEALRQSEARYRTLIEQLPAIIYIASVEEGNPTLFASPHAERILGYSDEEWRSTPRLWLERIHPEDRARVEEEWNAAHAEGRGFAVEYRMVTRAGQVVWFRDESLLLRDEHGQPLCIQGVMLDVTERRQAGEALRRSEEHFRSVIENSSDVVTLVDAGGTVRYVSPVVERVLGYAPDELVGRDAFELVHDGDREATRHTFAELVKQPGISRPASFRFRHKDGSWRYIETMSVALSTGSAEPGVLVNSRDVTERKLAEAVLAQAKEEAERAQEAAERANRAKSEFLSRMSHELRTPMNSILGFAQLLGRAELPGEHRKSVQHILKAGRHLLHLINEVLEIARIEAGRQNFSLEPVRIGTVLQEAAGLVRPLAAQWGVELDEGPWPHGDGFVRADRQRLVQVLLNLLSNAIKYNRPGGQVRLACAPAGAGGGLSVRVEDTGRGVPMDRLDQLFTPFARLGAEQTEVEGTGLGLALSQRLIEAMGGALSLERTSPGGSVFRLDLAPAADPVAGLDDSAATAEARDAAPHREATLLYIEDNLANLSLVETILLSRPRWRTVPALQGQLGVELAREHLPDVVLLDLHLPDISGEEVLRRLRGDERTAQIPVVVISADATRTSVDRLRAAGADAYLTKPLDIDEFLDTVGRFLREDRP